MNRRRVFLTRAQLAAADTIARTRQNENIAAGLKDSYGARAAAALELHLIGARCEAAFAKYMRLPHVKGERKDHDVGRYQVRGRTRTSYDLILHKSDPDDDPFVLVIGPTVWLAHGWLFDIYGWIYGREGKQPQWWGDPAGGRPAFFVPKHVLRPIETLP